MNNGLRKYNEVQRAVSQHLKDQGISLKDKGLKFHQIASKSYKQAKQGNFVGYDDNIDNIVNNAINEFETIPELTPTQLDWFAFYEFESNRLNKSVWDKQVAPANLYIRSFAFVGDIPAEELTYDDLQDLYKFFNDGRGEIWEDSLDVPQLKFTEPKPDKDNPKLYISELISDDPDNYGYIPGADDQTPIEPEVRLTDTEEAKPEKQSRIEKAKEKAAERSVKIRELLNESKKLDVELEKAKAQTFAEKNKLAEKYERYYNMGIYTKAEFKKKLDKLDL